MKLNPLKSSGRAHRAEPDPARGRRTRTLRGGAALLGALIVAGLATTAHAADSPTSQELRDKCGNGTDSCVFTPTQEWKTLANEEQVGASYWNCTATDQQAVMSWSQTKGSSDSVSVSINVSASFFKVYEAGISTSYGHTWEESHTWSEGPTITIPGSEVGWVTRGAPMDNVMGNYEMHFGSRYYGHYIWYLQNYTVTGPDPSGTAQVSFHNRAMTDQEKSAHCSSTGPNGVSLVQSTDTVPNGSGQTNAVLTRGSTSGTPGGGSPAANPGD